MTLFRNKCYVDGEWILADSGKSICVSIAPLFRFKDEGEAIRMDNDTERGLASYFYARDLRRVWRVREGPEYGMVGINTGMISTAIAPFGGVKESGLSREGSRYGIEDYLVMKYLCMGI